MSDVLVLDQLTKQYPNGFEAIQSASFSVKEGEFIVFVGPSGCGKSTLLRMIAGLEEISSGTLKLRGTRANDLAPKDRGIGMVFQSYALYPHMTAFENIAFALRLQKLSDEEIKTRVFEVAERLEITSLLQRKPKQMSGGQRQRIAMARAIARRPSIFLFDEPLSNLDAQLRGQMRVEIARLHKQLGATSLYVTHDQVEAMTLADRIVLLKDGQLQQIGSPLTLHDDPVNHFVATFIGYPQMNMLKVKAKNGSLWTLEGEELPIPSHINQSLEGDYLLGFRPHHTRVVEDKVRVIEDKVESHAEQRIGRLTVSFCEKLGHESLLHCDFGTQRVVLRVEGNPEYITGSTIHFNVESDRLLLFEDNENGARVR